MVIKLKAGRIMLPVEITKTDTRIFFKFKYNKALMAEIKLMQGVKWHGYDPKPRKQWSVANCHRNLFQIDYLAGKDPYARYSSDLKNFTSTRSLMSQQIEMVSQALTYHYMIWAAEMGTGKSLAAIELMEQAGLEDTEVWYVGPKAGVKAVKLELDKWDAAIHPHIMTTYEGLVKLLRDWDGSKPPKMVIFDESSKIKNKTSQRSQAAMHLANAVRSEYGDNGYVILMSGTPAPKSPVDWWHQAEVACPGFLVEGDPHKLRRRLGLTEERESLSGGVYPHHVTWYDDELKCTKCGAFAEDHYDHKFEKSVNEVAKLYRRMKGLTLVKFKKDCLDLPEKRYEIIRAKTTPEILRSAKLIKNTTARAISALILLRELSDGFQYAEEQDGMECCPLCEGRCVIEIPESGTQCPHCAGNGEIKKFKRVMQSVGSPKDIVFKDLLDEHDEVGRFIVWGGFTGTLDRLVEIAMDKGWEVLRVDGRGYKSFSDADADTLLTAMDRSHKHRSDLANKHPRICFVGHPRAGGMALTLTASPIELFYSNDFSGEARSQAEDRFHRPGMDGNKGGRIVDIIHLKTDELVLDNLKKKRKLETISMGDIVL